MCQSMNSHRLFFGRADEGKVFWTQLDALPQMPTIWHMDHMLRILDKEEFAELFLDTEQDWKPILK